MVVVDGLISAGVELFRRERYPIGIVDRSLGHDYLMIVVLAGEHFERKVRIAYGPPCLCIDHQKITADR